MGRLFLAIWLALFAVQTTDLLAAIAPDGCVEDVTGAPDPCPGSCARCICCARIPVATLPLVLVVPPRPGDPVAAMARVAVPASVEPRGIFHVPKDSSTRPV